MNYDQARNLGTFLHKAKTPVVEEAKEPVPAGGIGGIYRERINARKVQSRPGDAVVRDLTKVGPGGIRG